VGKVGAAAYVTGCWYVIGAGAAYVTGAGAATEPVVAGTDVEPPAGSCASYATGAAVYAGAAAV